MKHEPFNGKDVVEAFMPESLPPEHRLMSFLLDIRDTEHDRAILDTWKAHFRGKRIPFVVLKVGGQFRLYKERRV